MIIYKIDFSIEEDSYKYLGRLRINTIADHCRERKGKQKGKSLARQFLLRTLKSLAVVYFAME